MTVDIKLAKKIAKYLRKEENEYLMEGEPGYGLGHRMAVTHFENILSWGPNIETLKKAIQFYKEIDPFTLEKKKKYTSETGKLPDDLTEAELEGIRQAHEELFGDDEEF